MTDDEAEAVVLQTLFDDSLNMTRERLDTAWADRSPKDRKALKQALRRTLDKGHVVLRKGIYSLNV